MLTCLCPGANATPKRDAGAVGALTPPALGGLDALRREALVAFDAFRIGDEQHARAQSRGVIRKIEKVPLRRIEHRRDGHERIQMDVRIHVQVQGSMFVSLL
ncbi:MAG TPA: hypothetical protein VE175_12270, partial [Woeseiaceae bacterium]|nr:hypothetical protein [Woeseiaceae bacterium]